MTPEELVFRGTDTSNHYLKDSSQYKIIRYNEHVYAVNLNANSEAIDFVHLWKSHRGQNSVKESELGHGVQGTVYAKTEDKVKKTPLYTRTGKGRFPSKRNQVNPDELIQKTSDINCKILKQQFALKQNGLNSIFAFGLHSIKNLPDKPMIFMPKVASYKPRRKEIASMQLDFILKLKRVNEMGFAHDDYCGTLGVKHSSFQNEMMTRDGITLIDMDNGLVEINSINHPMRGQQARFRDQWLLAWLNKKNREVLPVLDDWYATHNYEPISESPEEILKIVKDLPQEIVDSITQQGAQMISEVSQSSLVTQSSEPLVVYGDELATIILQPLSELSLNIEQQAASSSKPDADPTERLSVVTDPHSESFILDSENSEQRAGSSSGPRLDSIEKLKTIRTMVVSKPITFSFRKKHLDERDDDAPENSSHKPSKGK
ncbi:MAG: hypothetical protein M1486_01470 [Gammaproteobacteria bacterium]|nr:hypothetical protein [Gammaproteobacteria bacterium]